MQVRRAVLDAGAVAVERIDLMRHRGAHPRIGAVDVVPFVRRRRGIQPNGGAYSAGVDRRLD
jgi:glutamate formiminotransferase